MRYSYRPSGVCSSLIQFDLNSGVISNVSFTGGCNGNLKALSKAIDGMTGEKVVELFRGIECGRKKTSCSDQLSRAVSEALAKETENSAGRA